MEKQNAFTIGYGSTPHGYDASSPVRPTPPRQRHVKAGIGANNGTIAALAAKRGRKLHIKSQG